MPAYNEIIASENPLPVHTPPQTEPLLSEVNTIKDRVNSINELRSAIPESMNAEIPRDFKMPTEKQIEAAEVETLHATKEENPELYEATLYEADARAAIEITEATGQSTAGELCNKVRNKAGEIMQTKPEISQKGAAALAISLLFEEDPDFTKLGSVVYGSFQTWALANIELNEISKRDVENKRRIARQKVDEIINRKK
jgi:hypothetical protein